MCTKLLRGSESFELEITTQEMVPDPNAFEIVPFSHKSYNAVSYAGDFLPIDLLTNIFFINSASSYRKI